MKVMKFIYVILLLFLLCSCQGQPELHQDNTDDPETNYAAETSPVTVDVPETEIKPPETTQADTAYTESDTQETETTIQTEELTPETETKVPETVPNEPEIAEPKEPPVLPDELHTNIPHPEAAFVLAEIYDAVSAHDNVSVYFIDVEGEYWFGIDEETRYHTASTIKPIYSQYLLSSGVDMDMEIKLQNVSRTSSSGKLTWEAVGSTFTVGELIEYSICYSDNQAHRLLYETFGIEGYNRYVSALGTGGLQLDEEWEWSRATPKKMSLAMLDIYRYSVSDDTIIEHLKNTDYNKQIPAGTKFETAHKYGSNGGTDGYHDTAIVYAPERPYILTILTGIDTAATDDENAIFRHVAALCDKLHSVLFVSNNKKSGTSAGK